MKSENQKQTILCRIAQWWHALPSLTEIKEVLDASEADNKTKKKKNKDFATLSTEMKVNTLKKWGNIFVLIVAIIDSAALGFSKTESIVANHGVLLRAIDMGCLTIFIGEATLKMFLYRWNYFKKPWHWMDLLIILASVIFYIPGLKSAKSLQIARLLRITRNIKALKPMRAAEHLNDIQKLCDSLGYSIIRVLFIMGFLLIVFYVYALVGNDYFAIEFPKWFGNLGKSMFTLFQIMTLESWTFIARKVMETHPWAWIYFISFIIITSFFILNIITGIIVQSIMESVDRNKKKYDEDRDEEQDEY